MTRKLANNGSSEISVEAMFEILFNFFPVVTALDVAPIVDLGFDEALAKKALDVTVNAQSKLPIKITIMCQQLGFRLLYVIILFY